MKSDSFLYKFYYQWWKNIDKSIFSIIILFFTIGLFLSLVSTSLIASDKLDTNSYFFFFKHLIYIFIGIFIIFIFSSINSDQLFRFSIILFFISLISLFLVPIIGIEVKGSKRWIDPGFLPRFQPVETLKPFFILLVSIILSKTKLKSLYYKYLLTLFVLISVTSLLVLQPDIGQTMLVFLTWLSLIFVSGINLLFFLTFFIFSGSILFYLIFFIPKFEYIKIRLISFLNPSSGNNYQSEKASEAIVNGSFFGKGIGEGELNTKIPEAHTDYIISVISEEFGVIIVLTIMLIFLIFSFNIIKKIDKENDNKVKLILVGVVSIILFQTFIHVGVNIRILPTTGMTLPFLSYGGSSIISTSILSGIILNLTKRKIS